MKTTLYKSTKTGASQQWSVWVEGDTFICEYGQVGGKLQIQSTKCFAKNLGRANETSPEQQAQLEAEALITKKLKSGYSYSLEAPSEVQLPMKVKSYQDQLNNVIFPCISTEKLNGVNGLFKRVEGKLTLYSRGGEVYPEIPHLTPHIHTVMDELGSNELNCELYIHGAHLQDIQSAVKKPNKLSPKLTANIFDIADSSDIYQYRRNKLKAIYSTLESIDHVSLKYIGFLIGVECNSHEQIELHYNQCMERNLEGTVIKNLKGLYQYNVRSSDQFKYKKTQSAEFLIVGYNLDKNGLPVFILKASDDFKAKPIGTKEFWSNFNPENYLGKWATIEFETYSKDGIPLKPIFVSLRECDSNGNPKE